MENKLGLQQLWRLWEILWKNMASFVTFFTQPFSDAMNLWLDSPLAPLLVKSNTVKTIIQSLVDNSFLANISLAEFILGSGIITIIIINFVKWVIGIVM